MKIKYRREYLELTDKDIIFDNGSCYQLTTQKVGYGWNSKTPVLSKTMIKKMIKNGELVLIKEEYKWTTQDGKEVWFRYYKINNK